MKRKLTLLSAFSILAISSAAMADTPYTHASFAGSFQPVAVSTIDADGDGMLSGPEIRAAMKLLRASHKVARAAKRKSHIAQFDSDGDGKLSKAERAAAKQARFAKLDGNGDGYISTDEASGTRLARRFAKLDADSNGLLTPAEMAAGKKHGRMGKGRKGKGRMGKGKGWKGKRGNDAE